MKVEDVKKTDPSLSFKYEEDVEGDENRGWRVDKIDAYEGDKLVGYCKIVYIPHDRFVKWYPSFFNYLYHIKGHALLPYEYRDKPLNEIPIDELRKNLVGVMISLGPYPSSQEQRAVQNMPDKEVIEQYKYWRGVARKRYGKEFAEFVNYHIDKPILDFINVDDKDQFLRVGEALAIKARDWMKERGLRLYLTSGALTNEKTLIDALKKKYPFKTEKTDNRYNPKRYYFA